MSLSRPSFFQNDLANACQLKKSESVSPDPQTSYVIFTQNEVGATFNAAAGKSPKVENQGAEPAQFSSARCFR